MAILYPGELIAPSSATLPPPTPPVLFSPLLPAVVFDRLPAELISHILSFLPLQDLISASQVSTLTYEICSSSILSPWAGPINIALDTDPYPESLNQLGCYSYIPRSTFLPILVKARPQFIGGPMQMPVGLRERDWEDVMRRRFLASWASESGNWVREGMKWKELFMR